VKVQEEFEEGVKKEKKVEEEEIVKENGSEIKLEIKEV